MKNGMIEIPEANEVDTANMELAVDRDMDNLLKDLEAYEKKLKNPFEWLDNLPF